MKINSVEFWNWAYGDFISNAQRGILAEYIVAAATGATATKRIEWAAYDIETPTGQLIEVKSAGYLQSWKQAKDSVIRFDISSKRSQEPGATIYSAEPKRYANTYVFCIFETKSREIADPLDTNQWSFLVCASSRIETVFDKQKSVGLAQLKYKLGLQQIRFASLAMEIAKNGA